MHLLIKICDDQPENVKKFLYRYYSTYSRKYQTDSGLDLVVPNDHIISAHQSQSTCIPLGICCAIVSDHPHGYYMYPRSSLAKTQLRLSNSVGIIDFSYRGMLMAYVDNIGESDQLIKVQQPTDDIDQWQVIKLFQLCSPDLTPISFELTETLETTNRGNNGFGSTGWKNLDLTIH
jgi:dUTP pyrophosphatase